MSDRGFKPPEPELTFAEELDQLVPQESGIPVCFASGSSARLQCMRWVTARSWPPGPAGPGGPPPPPRPVWVASSSTVRGVAYAFVGATIGTTAAFLLGRHAARPIVERWLHSAPRFVAVDRAVSAQGRRIVFLLRLSPIMPFNLLNYALGLTTISVWDFVLAGVGSLPSEFLSAYAGRVTGEALALAEQAEVPKNASYYAVLLGGLAATVAATLLVTRTARRALRDV